MKKPYKVLSTTALAAVLAASSLVPVMAQAAEANEVTDVIVTKDGVNYKMTIGQYSELLDLNKAPSPVKFITSTTGKVYTIDQYSDALDVAGNIDEALTRLDKNATAQTITTVDATFDSNGNLVTTPVAGDLKVESVMAINAEEVRVKFNKEMSASAAKDANYEISINGTIIPGATIIEDIALDGKTALIRLNEGSSLPSSHQFRLGDKIVVQTTDAITAADGSVLPRYSSEEIVYNVTSAPTVKDVAIDRTAGSENLTIEFDRPVDPTVDLVKVDGISLTNKTLVAVDDTKAGNYSYTFDISLSGNGAASPAPALTQSQLDSIKAKGNHEVTIFALTDTASANPAVNAAVNATYTVSEDTTAPKVISVTPVNGNKLFVETNRAVTLTHTAIKVEKGTHEFTNATTHFATPASAAASEVMAAPGTRNGKPGIYVAIKEAPTTDENPLYKGTETTAPLKITLENYRANDLIGTKYVGNVTLTKDAVKPKVKTSEVVDANNITVTLDKAVTQVNTLANDEVLVRNKDGVVLTTTVASVTGDTVTINSASAEFTSDKGPFTVEIAANELYYGETNSSVAAYQATSLRNDKLSTVVRPSESGFKFVEFVNASSTSDLNGAVTQTTAAGKNVITVDYKAEMTDSAKLASNYKLDGKPLPAGTVVDFVGDKENVHITLPKEAVKADGSYLIEISTNVTTKSGSRVVKDLQTRAPYTTTVVLADDTKPVLKEAVFIKASNTSTTSDVIKLTFSENIDSSVTNTDALKNLEVTINGSKQTVSIAASELSDGDDEVVITLPSAVSLTTQGNIKTVADVNGDVFIVDESTLANKLQIGTTVVADGSKAEIDLDAIADQAAANTNVSAATVNGATTATLTGITSNLTLAGANVTWSSSDTSVIANNGDVTRPAFADGDATVTLTASSTVNGQVATKDFTVTVTKVAASTDSALTGSAGFTVGGTPGSETLAIATGTTLAQLKAGISVDSLASYKVMNGATEVTGDTTVITSGNTVVVTAEDGSTTTYTISASSGTTYLVIDDAELQAAIGSAVAGDTIQLAASFSGDIALNNKLVNIDLNNKTLTGNLSVTDTTSTGTVTLSSTGGAGTVTGTLTVNTPNADFVVGTGVTVTGLTTITDVNGSTFTNNGTLGAVKIDDNDLSFVNAAGSTVGDLTITGVGSDVRITATEPIGNVIVTGEGAKLNVVSGTINTVISKATDVVLTGNGTVTEKKNDGGTIVDGDGVTIEPTIGEGTTRLKLADGKEMDNLIFKVSGIKDGKSEAKLTLDKLKTAYSEASETDLKAIAKVQVDGEGSPTDIDDQVAKLKTVKFQTDGITVTDGVLNIPTAYTNIFTESHFAIVKTTDSPFHISVYYADNAGGPASENRLAKITITKDGVTFTDINTAAINK